MLSDLLNTNEVKNAAGVEVEFERFETVGRSTTFHQIGESPAKPHTLSIKHAETGTGLDRRRSSAFIINKTVDSDVDTSRTCVIRGTVKLDVPVGMLETTAEFGNVLAEMMSFLASKGLSSTILYDCTGNGAKSLLEGSL